MDKVVERKTVPYEKKYYFVEKYYSLLWGKDVDFRDVLYEMYYQQGMSVRQVAKELNISCATVQKKIKQYGITHKIEWK